MCSFENYMCICEINYKIEETYFGILYFRLLYHKEYQHMKDISSWFSRISSHCVSIQAVGEECSFLEYAV